MDAPQDRAPTVVHVAGIGNSGPDHWQRRWFEQDGGVWVEHRSWDRPVREVWVHDLDETIRRVDGPVVLVAHSLGCTVVAAWAAGHHDGAVRGALLVAVPDVEGPAFPVEAQGFEAPGYRPLPFPAVVVVSDDDPYGSPEHAERVAARLGADVVRVGEHGHLNAASGLGDWPEGRGILATLLPD